MRYILNERYTLCGWKNMRFALAEGSEGRAYPLQGDAFRLLLKCSGKRDILTEELDGGMRTFLDRMLENGVVRPAVEGERRTLAYTSYPGIYKSSVLWSVTGRCNYSCRHCFQSAPEGALGEPSLEQCFDVLRQFRECGIMNVSLTGGEPLVRGDLMRIIDELLHQGLRLATIYSNGSLVTDELLANLARRDLVPGFQISFDGVGCHDWMRGVPGAEELALDAVRRAHKRGHRVGCSMCLCRENVGSIRETVRRLAECGCSYLKLQRSMPMGEWAKEEEHFLSYGETLQAYLDYLPQYREDGMPLDIQMEGFFSYTRGKGYANLSDRRGREELFGRMPPCGAIAASLYVGPNGAVTPCMSMCGAKIEEQFPNLFETPLREILSDSSYTRLTGYRVSDVFSHNAECASCAYRARCCSGCRAFAVGDAGDDYLAVDRITCMILRDGWSERLDEAADRLFEKRKTPGTDGAAEAVC